MPAGRPRSAIPDKDDLIKLGEKLVEWSAEKQKRGDAIRVRFCDWYTAEGFVRKQWEHMREKPEFQWYYETARSLLALRYIDGTVNQSIAHRYLRMYDPELRDQEDKDENAKELRKAAALKGETRALEEERLKVIDEVQRNKRTLK